MKFKFSELHLRTQKAGCGAVVTQYLEAYMDKKEINALPYHNFTCGVQQMASTHVGQSVEAGV
ncbi:hypothetical protein NECAME_08125 [Necator americanus]|uniref:Uncharacterized protein n=1 Tax=Necator americanus TaxID=51031 RepID=W2TKI0_NECAM|nr:hypothetical protein NECAME_08125 [Necator americanus]ETN82134.1 hypothetical protein NECAME_08125 [Necator americanus]